MIIFGRQRRGKPKCSTKPRRIAGMKTKAEKRLENRIASYNASARILGIHDARAEGYHKPGSLQAS